MKCETCGKDTFLPFKCPYCGGAFCAEHRLPENHKCEEIDQARRPKETEQTPAPGARKPFENTHAHPLFKTRRKRFAFSRKEIIHLSVAVALVIGVGLSFPNINYVDYSMLALLSVLFALSFLIHEIAHKTMAQSYGLWAEFRLNIMGLFLTLLSLIPSFIKIIGPGAVVVSGSADRKTIGKTSIIGPTTNLILASIFCAATVFVMHNWIFSLVAFYNAWIAIFNLIPLGVLDGYKVFVWDKKIWVSAFAASVTLGIIAYQLLLSTH
jgi:Zn-dependent protease